jgi:hypothetical protein
MSKPKWRWKNGRLHHPTEGFSIGIEEAYMMQENNDDVAKACEGVLKVFNQDDAFIHERIINELREEMQNG